MGLCLVEGCGGFALTGDICALCANTRPVKKLTKATHLARERATEAARAEAARSNPDAAVLLMCAGGASEPNAAFFAACQDYSGRFFAILARGRQGTTEMVHGCDVYHDTQPRANRTVFYDWQGINLRVFGVGQHSGGDGAGNDSYSFVWFDGKNRTYTRG